MSYHSDAHSQVDRMLVVLEGGMAEFGLSLDKVIMAMQNPSDVSKEFCRLGCKAFFDFREVGLDDGILVWLIHPKITITYQALHRFAASIGPYLDQEHQAALLVQLMTDERLADFTSITADIQEGRLSFKVLSQDGGKTVVPLFYEVRPRIYAAVNRPTK